MTYGQKLPFALSVIFTLFSACATTAIDRKPSAQSEVAFEGTLMNYDEVSDSWSSLDTRCGITVFNPRNETDDHGLEHLNLDLKLEGFGGKWGNGKPKDGSVVKQTGIALALYEPNADVVRFGPPYGDIHFTVKNGKLDDFSQLRFVPIDFIIGETTLTGGHYGGKRYKWRLKCDFAH